MLLIFIGYVFIFFNFPVHGFDILADFVGYVFVYFGLTKFPEERNFVNGKPFAQFMALLTFIYSVAGKWIPGIVLAGMGVLNVAMSLYLLFLINSGIKEIERCNHFYLKSDKIMSTWRLIAIFTIGNAFISFIPIEMLQIVANMFGIAATIMQLVYLFHLISVKEGMDQMNQKA